MPLTDWKVINQKRLIHIPTIFHIKIDSIWFNSQINFLVPILGGGNPPVYCGPETIPDQVCGLDN